MVNALYQTKIDVTDLKDVRKFHREFIFNGLKLIYLGVHESRIKLLSDTFDEIYDFNTDDVKKVEAFNVKLNGVLDSLNNDLKLTTPQIERTYKLIEDLRQEAIEELSLLQV